MTCARCLNSWVRRARAIMLTVPLFGLAACGSGDASDSSSTAGDRTTENRKPAAIAELGTDSYTFERSTCDLEDSIDDDILARASGTTPDGRRVSIEVERRQAGSGVHERVTVYFGRMMEGDQWHAVASGEPGGPWSTGNVGGEARSGPLIVLQGDELTATGSFRHETRDAMRDGSIRIMCGVG